MPYYLEAHVMRVGEPATEAGVVAGLSQRDRALASGEDAPRLRGQRFPRVTHATNSCCFSD
ncbi:hypothetical protein DFAR_2090032 [Desulfarculales bacterium]